ncbi:carboxylic ester hydrolase-like isoform X2 [Macrobrachium nipponense]|uniref:carboxylic ester hydrolase-like isoform X2 n=1 Tax=Macrobrachium nipponense TaxID=159736 RepID=UPI0030C808D0
MALEQIPSLSRGCITPSKVQAMKLLNLVVSVLIGLGGNELSEASNGGSSVSSDDSLVSRFAESTDVNYAEVKMKTTMGTIIGLRVPSVPPHVANSHHYAFRGIPYAKPPVDELRFRDPVDLKGAWPGRLLNATQFGSVCTQYDPLGDKVYGSEDCLFLNVFTPYLPGKSKKDSDELLPVLFFIHGGAYVRGAGNPYGPERLMARNLVFVTFNYRLGALGFLSTRDSLLPGNYGALDQVSALRWVKRHISEFGGDPKQITVGGFSAGSASANLHLYSPLTKDLVHRAIMLSGAASCTWAVQGRPEVGARLLAAELSCPTAPTVALSSCVKKKDAGDIVRAQFAVLKLEFIPAWFAPIVDGGLRPRPFLPAPLDELSIRPVPALMGKVLTEGLMFAANAAILHRDETSPSALYDVITPITFIMWNDSETFSVMDSVAQNYYYSSHARDSKDLLVEGFTKAATDRYFHLCVDDMASHLSSLGSPVYVYMMTHRDPESPTWALPHYRKMKEMGYTSRMLAEGVSHGDDLLYLFSVPSVGKIESQRDQRVSDVITSMVANFVMNGKPEADLESLSDIPVWEPVKPGEPIPYYDLTPNPVMVHEYFGLQARNFWKQVVPGVLSLSSKPAGESQNFEEDCRHVKGL